VRQASYPNAWLWVLMETDVAAEVLRVGGANDSRQYSR